MVEMTFNPTRLLQWREYMQRQTGLPAVSLGIAGSAGHREVGTSYHLGLDDLKLWKDPYSYRTERDRRGASDAASATDTGSFARHGKTLVGLTIWAVAEARAGRRPDTREIIGPWSDGRAYRFDHLNGWRAELRPRGDSHETHMHESRYRDAEHRDWIRYYRGYFEEDDMATPQEIAREVWNYPLSSVPQGIEDKQAGDWQRYGRLAVVEAKRLVPQLAELRAQVAGLTELVERALAAPPVQMTPEQLAAQIEAVSTAARAGAEQALEAVQIDVVDAEEPG